MRLPPGVRITFENATGAVSTGANAPGANAPGAMVLQQQIWMLDGQLEVQLAREVTRLVAGDCMAMTLDRAITVHNPGDREARYLVAVAGKQ
jgi:hypothetical protein